MKQKPRRLLKTVWLPMVALCGLSAFPLSAEIPCVWTGIDKIVAIGDLHGDYENFVKILVGAGLVDESLHWAGGTSHFVQSGDMMDRGPDAKKIFDLLMRLEKEAKSAGGMVHVLIGNHEEMNITGIVFSYPDYVSVGQFLSFLPKNCKRAKEKELQKTLRGHSSAGLSKGTDQAISAEAEKYWQNLMRTDLNARRMYMEGFRESYGRWLLEKNAVIRINDTIFVHGGISEKYATWKLEAINNLLRRELSYFFNPQDIAGNQREPIKFTIVYDPEGPLWFRGLALGKGNPVKEEFNRILSDLGANHMVIAHTYLQENGAGPIVSPRFISRFDEKLWIIDTGISSYYYGGANCALIIDKGDFTLWTDKDEEEINVAPSFQKGAVVGSAEDQEKLLRSLRIGTIIRLAQRGRTEPWTIILEDGEIFRKALFKYVDRPRPSPLPASFRYELAAYELDKLLGLGIVPPVVQREIDGLQGSLQLFVENAIPETKRQTSGPQPPDPEKFREALETVKLFSLLVGDKCENLDDTLIDLNRWQVQRVDFSEAFNPSPELARDCAVSSLPETFFKKLKNLDDLTLSKDLSPYLNEDEVRALLQRKAELLRAPERLSPAVNK